MSAQLVFAFERKAAHAQKGFSLVELSIVLLIIGIVSLSIHALFIGGLGRSALLYMLIPYSVSLMIAAMRFDTVAETNGKKYLRHMMTALLIFLATSVVLREGFVCVIFFILN